MRLIGGFQGRGTGADVVINADEVQGVVERFVVGGVYCEVHMRGGVRFEVWGKQAAVIAKLEAKR